MLCIQAGELYGKAESMGDLCHALLQAEDFSGMEQLCSVLPQQDALLHKLGARFQAVGLVQQAVDAFCKVGCCTDNCGQGFWYSIGRYYEHSYNGNLALNSTLCSSSCCMRGMSCMLELLQVLPCEGVLQSRRAHALCVSRLERQRGPCTAAAYLEMWKLHRSLLKPLGSRRAQQRINQWVKRQGFGGNAMCMHVCDHGCAGKL